MTSGTFKLLMVRKARQKVYMADSTSFPKDRNEAMANPKLPKFSLETSFDRFERTKREGLQVVKET